MNQTDGVKLVLGGTTHTLRFTIQRLRDLGRMTGKGMLALTIEAGSYNFDSIVLVLWGALAHPGNGMEKATIDDVAKLIGDDLTVARKIVEAITEVTKISYDQVETSDPNADPSKPTG